MNIAGINYADTSDVSLTDPQGWNQVGFNNVPDFTDTVKGLRGELDGVTPRRLLQGMGSRGQL